MNLLRQLTFVLSRFLICAWVGAAILFVITSVAEQTSDNFNDVVKDQLALIRFPYYYLVGFIMVGGSLASLALTERGQFRVRWWLSIGLLSAALAIMLIDYFAIYMPLQNIITPAGQPRNEEFERYHTYSEYVNTLHVGIAFIVAMLLCSIGMGKSKAVS
ncbi:MAG: hypothetical protein CMJ46_16355 [Planctomyces sp.]|nr:hypothetical protein [Planctomyces sp.]